MAINTARCKSKIENDLKSALEPVLNATKNAQGEDAGDLTIDDIVDPIMEQVGFIVDRVFEEILGHMEINYKLTAAAGIVVPDALHPSPPGRVHIPPAGINTVGSPAAQATVAPLAFPVDGVVIPEGKGLK